MKVPPMGQVDTLEKVPTRTMTPYKTATTMTVDVILHRLATKTGPMNSTSISPHHRRTSQNALSTHQPLILTTQESDLELRKPDGVKQVESYSNNNGNQNNKHLYSAKNLIRNFDLCIIPGHRFCDKCHEKQTFSLVFKPSVVTQLMT